MNGTVAFLNGCALVQVVTDGRFGLFNPAQVKIQECVSLLAVKGKSGKHQDNWKTGLLGCLNDAFRQGKILSLIHI